MAFTGELANVDLCPGCEEPCYKFGETSSQKKAAYWSLIDSLQAQYGNKNCSETLHYWYNYTSTHEYALGNQIGDIFDGSWYKSLSFLWPFVTIYAKSHA